MPPQLPITFIYQRSNTLSSWLWSLWLQFPIQLRARVYRLFWQHTGKLISACVRRLPCGIFAKATDSEEEVLATEFVRLNTTIPVPKVLDFIPYGPGVYGTNAMFLTKRIPGVPLPNKWDHFNLNTATQEQKEIFQHTLYDWLSQLRKIPSPYSGKVCGFTGGALHSVARIDSDKRRVGPFSNVKDFHAQNFCTAYPDYPDEADEKTRRLILERPFKDYQTCLTHGDLLPHNILIDINGRPCGWVDWESASWMPEYWEQAVALRVFHRYPGWADTWGNMFPENEDDICIERQIWKWWIP